MQVILDGIAQLDTTSLEDFAGKVSHILASRKAPALTRKETDLLKSINQGISPAILSRFDELQLKQKTESLTSSEKDELTQLIDVTEVAEVKRLQSLTVLAGLWKVSVEVLRQKLGINAPEPHAW